MPNGKNRYKLFVLALALAAGFCTFAPAPAQGIPNEDVIFLIDCSQSSPSLLPAIAGILNRFVAGAAAGDSFTCYQFSNSPVLFAKGKVTGDADIKNLQAQLLNLREGSNLTSYSSAIEKAMSDLLYHKRNRPANDRLLIMITDGRSSDDRWTEKSNLMALLRPYSEMKVGSEYFFTCFFIGDRAEEDLQLFLNAAGAQLVYWPKDKNWLEQLKLGEVRILEQDKIMGNIPETPAYSDFKLSFHPRRVPQKFSMIEFDIEEDFLKQSLDRLFDVRPRRISLREQPWTETFALETRGFQKGEYKGRFLFRPSEPQVFLLIPYSVPFRFSVSNSLQVSTPQPLSFGPTGLQGSYEETKCIYIRSGMTDIPGDAASVKAESDISLPEGFRLNISPVSKEKEIVIYVTLARDEAAPKLSGKKYEGTIGLTLPAGWALSQNEFPLTVLVEDEPVNYRLIAVYASVGVGAILVGFICLFSFPAVRREASGYLMRKAHPSGKLMILKDPTRDLPKTFNLTKISERGKKKEVLVGGMGENADIEIPHISMVDKLYLFTGLKTGSQTETFLTVLQGAAQVIINGVPRHGKVPLKHLDLIKMGALELRYEEPLLLQQVVLYYLSGEVKQGWLLDWNMKIASFRLLLRADVQYLSEIEVCYRDLKAVAFLRDFEGELNNQLLSLKIPRQGHVIKITFLDQEELTGYVFDWKEPGERFYFIPKEMGPNIMFFLIERAAVKELKVLKEDELSGRQGAKKFSRVTKRMSWV